nr:MAG TPA: hypothetical protein [Caudoviricetes sp.]
MRVRYNKATVNEWKGKHRELKKHGHLKKNGFVYSHIATLDGKMVAVCERANDLDYIVEVKREK